MKIEIFKPIFATMLILAITLFFIFITRIEPDNELSPGQKYTSKNDTLTIIEVNYNTVICACGNDTILLHKYDLVSCFKIIE